MSTPDSPVGFINGVATAWNGDFTGSDASSINNGLITDNQVWMGGTTPNANNSHVFVKTITAGTGIDFDVTDTTFTINNNAPTTDLHVARYIVSAGGTGDGANYTTIGAALAAAVSAGGVQTIAIQPGTYTESFTWPANINITAFDCDPLTPSVTIIGKITCTDAGSRSMSGIFLQTNGDYILSVTGSAATDVRFFNCYLNCTDNTGIQITSSGLPDIQFLNCTIDIVDVSGSAHLAMSGGGSIFFTDCNLLNSGGSSTATTVANSGLYLKRTSFVSIISASGSTNINSSFSSINARDDLNSRLNQIGVLLADNATFNGYQSIVCGGNQRAISIGAGCQATVFDTVIESSHATSAITGAGTIFYGGLVFVSPPGVTSAIDVTTQNVRAEGPSRTIGSANSGATNTLTLTNTSNTASSASKVQVTVGGTSAADPQTTYTVTGAANWSHGIDNSVDDNFVLAASTQLGTTNVMSATTGGAVTKPLQPAFLAYQASTATNATGDGTTYVLGTTVDLTEVYDQNNNFDPTTGVFTAPVTGKYMLMTNIFVNGGTDITEYETKITTSNREYRNRSNFGTGADRTSYSISFCVLADMDINDTATFSVYTLDAGGKIDDVFGAADEYWTTVSGYLAC